MLKTIYICKQTNDIVYISSKDKKGCDKRAHEYFSRKGAFSYHELWTFAQIKAILKLVERERKSNKS